MANLHDEFGRFHDAIQLSANRHTDVQIARNRIRERIRSYFFEILNQPVPRFRSLGSDVIGTSINSLNDDCGTTDGVYLQLKRRHGDGNWPTASTVHQWLIKATGGQPLDDHTGVQALYSGSCHVNLRIYRQLDGKTMLAVNNDTNAGSWLTSDPLPFIRWFRDYANLRGEQLRRVVRYLKAWADLQSCRLGPLPGGFVLTSLAVNHFQDDKRDDVAMTKTLMEIATAVQFRVLVLNPVNIYEELSASLTDAQKTCFQEAVREAAADAFEAVATENRREASRYWRKQLGDRFPSAP
jgi:hypothetical protein